MFERAKVNICSRLNGYGNTKETLGIKKQDACPNRIKKKMTKTP